MDWLKWIQDCVANLLDRLDGIAHDLKRIADALESRSNGR